MTAMFASGRDVAGRERRVFLTGATGNWGRQVLHEFRERGDRFHIVALVPPGPDDRRIIQRFQDMPNLTVVSGDLRDYSVVESGVRGADYVLHIGAVVSPHADDHPGLAHRVNVGGARNIIRAVKAQPRPDAIGVVMVGSVAETGDRNPPRHWGRVGDPLRPARYDEYAQSKIVAERELVDSGLPRWAWLRQTGILHPGLLRIRDPIMLHTPLAGAMEWISVRDAARLMVNICSDGVPERFWGGIYNVGGGEGWRLTNWELLTGLTAALGVSDVRRWYERGWFATRNFHGHWFTDSDRLEQLVHFRDDTFECALGQAVRAAPVWLRAAGMVPGWAVKHLAIKPLARHPRGPMAWIDGNDDARVRTYFGSREEWQRVGDWSTFQPPAPDRAPSYLDHGYDEARSPRDWTVADLAGAAHFRGGVLLSERLGAPALRSPLRWRCAAGHEFSGSPFLILVGGHWCPVCVRDPAGFPAQAERNAFLAQVQ